MKNFLVQLLLLKLNSRRADYQMLLLLYTIAIYLSKVTASSSILYYSVSFKCCLKYWSLFALQNGEAVNVSSNISGIRFN